MSKTIEYRDAVDELEERQLTGFFVGWPDPPSPATLLRILAQSQFRWVAVDRDSHQVVGFVNAISDGVLSAYIPLLEVLPEYQGQGIGQELMRRMMQSTAHLYMCDLLCDAELQPYYEKLGMRRGQGMLLRRYDRQSGG
jgi:ribosomal protein S18 acetylase RimI-like enzyme